MMLKFRFIIVASYVSLLLFTVSLTSPALCSSEEEAEQKIQAAETEVLNCYAALSDAEKAGADVNELLGTLNEAGWFLSRAKHAYGYKDYGSAVEFANQSLTMLSGIVDRANVLKLEAEHEHFSDFLYNFVGSAVGSVAVGLGGYAFWILLKKRGES